MDDEDDYLSDKFLLQQIEASSSSTVKTYSDRRKENLRKAQIKNETNRQRSRRQRQDEALEEGLKTSLFEKAKAEEEQLGTKNKAIKMMEMMGFKPGQTLGRGTFTATEDATEAGPPPSSSENEARDMTPDDSARLELQHRKEPLAIDVWEGKKGVGLKKRAISPSASERLSKLAKVAEDSNKDDFRVRARREYEERRAEGRLVSATRTLQTLDDDSGVQFNILSLNPRDPESFPLQLLDELEATVASARSSAVSSNDKETEALRLKRQMQLDALQPLQTNGPGDNEDLAEEKPSTEADHPLTEEDIDCAKEFLGLNAQDRLNRVTTHLRRKYFYCFWCGTQYGDDQELADNCPGEDEEAHD